MTVTRWNPDGFRVRGQVKMPDGSTRKYSKILRGITKRDAVQWEAEHRAAIVQGRVQHEEKRAPTLSEFVTDFLRYCKVESENSVNELANKDAFLKRYIAPFFGSTRLDAIDAASLLRFKEHLATVEYRVERKDGSYFAKPLHPKTQNNILTCLGTLLKTAVLFGHITTTPRVTLLEVPEARADFLDFEELPRVINAARGDFALMVLLAAKTGLRQGELVALRWCDVDLEKGWLHVSRTLNRDRNEELPKSGKARDVPLPAGVRQELGVYHAAKRPGPRDLVFPAPDGSHLSVSGMRGAIRRIGKRAGIKRDAPGWFLGWHDLRHTYATHLLMRGANIFLVSRYLGHADVAITQRVYAHVIPKEGAEAVAVIDDCHGLVTPGSSSSRVANLQVERGLRRERWRAMQESNPPPAPSASPIPTGTSVDKTGK